ncbi:MAG: hypothetical protein ACHREM_18615, partial [Polyangiales bacterium]
AHGFTCDATSGSCVQGATCSADGSESTSATGVSTACTPYLCDSTGKCPQTCATSSGCATGFACDGAHCVASGGTTSSGGCAVHVTGANTASGAGLALALAALSIAYHRRARSQRRCERERGVSA